MTSTKKRDRKSPMMVIHHTGDKFGDVDWEIPRYFTKRLEQLSGAQLRIRRDFIKDALTTELMIFLLITDKEGDDFIRAIDQFRQSKERLIKALFPDGV